MSIHEFLSDQFHFSNNEKRAGKQCLQSFVSLTHLCQYNFCTSEYPLKPLSNIKEDIFIARNCEATHWMIIAKLFLSLTQQILKFRMVKYDMGITNLFIFSPTYTATKPFGTSIPFEEAKFLENEEDLLIPGKRKPIVFFEEKNFYSFVNKRKAFKSDL